MAALLEEAERAAREALHNGSVTLSEWALVANVCARTLSQHGLEDPAVSRAAQLAPVVTSPSEATSASSSSLVQAFMAAQDVELRSEDREKTRDQARRSLLFATHAAARSAGGIGQVLLGAVERELLDPVGGVVRAEPFERSLSRWRDALGQEATHLTSPHMALAIAHTQQEILSLGKGLVSRVDENPAAPGSLDRMLRGIDASNEAWQTASQKWRSELRRGVLDVDTGQVAHLSLAVQDVRSALRMQLSPSEQLEALVSTGFGGNIVATILTASEDRWQAESLVGAARSLDQVGESLIGQSAGPPFTDREMIAVLPPEREAVAASIDQSHAPVQERGPIEPPAPSKRAVEAQGIMLDVEIENELARRRDIGVWARAALDGDPTAKMVGPHVSEPDLERLVEGGRHAQATLVASAMGIIGKNARNIHWNRDLRNERFQDGAVDMAAAAQKWDPSKSRWFTYATYVAQWAHAHAGRRSYKNPIPAELDDSAKVMHVPGSNTEANALDSLMTQEVRDQVRKLPPQMQTIVESRLGLDGHEKKSQVEIGEELGISATSVSRGYVAALATLKRNMDAPEQGTATPQSSIEELQQRVEKLKNPARAEAPLQRVERLLDSLVQRPVVSDRSPTAVSQREAPGAERDLN